MKIQNIKTSLLIPYEWNTKKHDKTQVNNVAESIKQYGFVQPIVVDKNNVVVIGHCRLLAAKQLQMKDVPCVCVEDLTEEQVKALRIVDNKSNESEWDLVFLADELEQVDLFGFDFDFAVPGVLEDIQEPEKEPSEKESHREVTNKQYNLDMFDASRCVGFYEMPIIRKSSFIPSDLIGFNYALNSKNKRTGIHCFVDDYQISRLWNNPNAYIEAIAGYECFLSPDFSLYLDMPMAMKVWNVYRSRMVGQYYQDHGIEVIPTVSWAEPETFDFCFDGIEQGATVAVSTIGVKRNEYAQKIWQQGMDEMIRIVDPANILLYGGVVEYDYKGIPIFEYKNHVTETMQHK